MKKDRNLKSSDSFWDFANNLASKKSFKASSDYLAQVIAYLSFTSAIQLLQCVGTFACCVSALGQYVPYYQIWYTENYFSMTMLTQCLDWTLVPHKEIVYTWSWTQVVRKPSLQVAGLQVHATTLSWWYTIKKGILFCETPQNSYVFIIWQALYFADNSRLHYSLSKSVNFKILLVSDATMTGKNMN